MPKYTNANLPTNFHRNADLIKKDQERIEGHIKKLPKLCKQYGLMEVYEWAKNGEISDSEIEDAVYEAIEDLATANLVSSALKEVKRKLLKNLRYQML